ncbi:MAG TPA: M23 family metallopeptidase [Hanamia sp.]
MLKYLITILIFITNIKTNVAFSQIITISPTGRKIISPMKPDKTIIVAGLLVTPIDSSQLIGTQNDDNYNKQLDLTPTEIVSPPLNEKLYVTSDFGERFHPILHNETLHAGIDLRADYEMVNTIANGIIVKEDYDARAGNYIVIQHGNGIESIYCHLSKFLFNPGDLVFGGDGIAISGASGAVTAPHLHFAIKENGKFIDPLPLLRAIAEYDRKILR